MNHESLFFRENKMEYRQKRCKRKYRKIFILLLSVAFLLAIFFIFVIKFSRRSENKFIVTKMNSNDKLLNYFNINNNDAFLVSWSHAVNSKEKLDNVIKDSKLMFIESDILMSKTNEVIMAHPPNLESDLKFDEWLNICKNSNKGLKLDFKTENVIESCLKKLKSMSSELQMPIMLNADILQANVYTSKPIINSDYFLNITKFYMPDSILSIGWTTINSSKLNYTWFNAFEMYNLVLKYNLTNLTLPVRTNWALKSLYRLNWLTAFTKSTLTLWSHDTDEFTSIESLLLFRKYFNKSVVFYDLPERYLNYLSKNLDNYENILAKSSDNLVNFYLKNDLNFKLDLWLSNGNVLLNEYGGLMCGYGAMLATRKEYKADNNNGIIYELTGKFEIISNLVNSSSTSNNNDKDDDNDNMQVIGDKNFDKNLIDQTNAITSDCFKISLRTNENFNDLNNADDGSVDIIIFFNGLVRLEVNKNVIQEGNLYSITNLFEFLITDVGEDKNIHIDLINYDSNMNKFSLQFLLNSTYFHNQKFFIKIKLLSSIYSIGIDQLKLSDEISDPLDDQANANY